MENWQAMRAIVKAARKQRVVDCAVRTALPVALEFVGTRDDRRRPRQLAAKLRALPFVRTNAELEAAASLVERAAYFFVGLTRHFAQQVAGTLIRRSDYDEARRPSRPAPDYGCAHLPSMVLDILAGRQMTSGVASLFVLEMLDAEIQASEGRILEWSSDERAELIESQIDHVWVHVFGFSPRVAGPASRHLAARDGTD